MPGNSELVAKIDASPSPYGHGHPGGRSAAGHCGDVVYVAEELLALGKARCCEASGRRWFAGSVRRLHRRASGGGADASEVWLCTITSGVRFSRTTVVWPSMHSVPSTRRKIPLETPRHRSAHLMYVFERSIRTCFMRARCSGR